MSEARRGHMDCGLEGRKGRLQAGFDADLLVVAGDPIAEIDALKRISAVVCYGCLV